MSGWAFRACSVLLGAICAFVGAGVSGCGRVGFELTEPDGGAEECPTPCENPNGTADCSSGECELSCAIGFEDCDGDPANGCETSTTDRADSCGGCETQCENPNGATACADGLCSPRCDSGHGDCDGDLDNGCETPLTRTADCGACDADCSNPNGTTACVEGACEPTCASGHDDCDGDPDNGCEADILDDPSHCGGCDSACDGSDQICVDGACEASPCSEGRGECDGDLDVTCETDLTSDPAHCGFCTNACTTLNGTPACTDGSCDVASCEPGYGDCDGDPADCEIELATSTDHCGACDAPCTNAHGTTRCAASSCDPSCESGWGDCDGSPENGCETSLTTVSDCGMCGMSCPAGGGTAVCNAGVCDTRCDLTGTFALYLRVFSEWPRTGEVDDGSGWFEWWVKVDTSHSGDTADAQVRLCGGFIPPQDSRLFDATFLYAYPDSLFDGGGLPASSGTISLADSSPDSALTLPTVVLQLGIDMADPLNDPWPSQASGISAGMRVDMDGDGNPGVTAAFSNDNGYDYPRTSDDAFGYNEADRAYVASRISFSLNGALSSCTESSGNANFPHVQARILGCRRAGGGTCDADEADFLDDSAVPFTLSNATYTMTKVADGASCATIRNALP